MTGDRTPTIVGIGLSDIPIAPHLTAFEHHALAGRRALEDAGVDLPAVDGFMCTHGRPANPDLAANMAEYLGIRPRWLDGTMTGGSSFETYLQHASAAIETGHCDVVLVTYGSDQLSRQGRTIGTRGFVAEGSRVEGPLQYESPFGSVLVGAYAMAAQRHMYEFGTTSEQLASIAVATRYNAGFNDRARYRKPITVDDVVNSRLVADPLHLLDCCTVTDGGGAVVITTAERARDLPRKPVTIASTSFAGSHWNISQMPDYTTTAAAVAAPDLYARAGLKPSDIDIVQLYDSFTITVLLLLEDLGFCSKGEGGEFVSGDTLTIGGRLPCNTDGGGLSALHPGMRGMFLILEAVRQLRGDAGAAQVPDARTALVCGSGGWLSHMGAAILVAEA